MTTGDNLSVSSKTIPVATLGAPRIGPRRELKTALESFWAGKIDEAELRRVGADLRQKNWARQKALGVDVIPSNDFSFYDQVLDTSVMVGAIPPAYGWKGGLAPLSVYFAMARGAEGEKTPRGAEGEKTPHGAEGEKAPSGAEGKDASCGCGGAHGQSAHGESGADGSVKGVPAQEMTKWFDTNYHYLAPEFWPGQKFELASLKAVEEYREAKAQGHDTRPVLVGPVTFLKLGKSREAGFDPVSLLDALVPVYIDVLRRLRANGAQWVQIDEPILVLDLDETAREALRRAYAQIARALPDLKIMLATYFGALEDNLDLALSLPVAGLHLDLARAPGQLAPVLEKAPRGLVLSLGVIDGRNIWRADLAALRARLEDAVSRRGLDHVQVAPSCSLLHVPVDVELETGLDAEVKSWLSFAAQKMDELAALAAALSGEADRAREKFAASAAAIASRRRSIRVHDPAVESRVKAAGPELARRLSPFARREAAQRARFGLPLFPTTTIGSFPQTPEVRKARADHDKGRITDAEYETFLREETARAIRWQEEIDLDVLVHGEFERNDMVQYFGERLSGFAFSRHGWVQSYGSRCVRPPILFGDVSRPEPMTVEWWRYAQSLSKRPVKAMLTGPVTILNWSFVRDDLARAEVCEQIAFAIRDEVADLETAGSAMIQIDEAALREGLPLRRKDWDAYLDSAVKCFRICAGAVGDETQIHTHMCYSEFNDIIEAIAAMDADVISIETSRSKMELLDAFRSYKYPNEIGPGVYDIHSPRVPSREEMEDLLVHARARLADGQIWVNPDCGLKTRKWDEVRPALINMVAAAKGLRDKASRDKASRAAV